MAAPGVFTVSHTKAVLEPDMSMKFPLLIAACAAIALGAGAAFAQPEEYNDPSGYYSQTDHAGFYDSDGNYRHIRNDGR